MRAWLILLIFLVGLAAGVSGMSLAPRLIGPYLPRALRGKVEAIEGAVVAKRRESDRLLLTVVTPRGAILVTFKKKLTEIDLLVERGDTLTLALPRYEPFVEEPPIERVGKPKPAGEPDQQLLLPSPRGRE